MMLGYDAYDVVMRLVGPVRAVGDSRIDSERLVNLNHLTQVVEKLLQEISEAAMTANRQEASMKAIGVVARDFLRSLRSE
jgi:hypothetical protein